MLSHQETEATSSLLTPNHTARSYGDRMMVFLSKMQFLSLFKSSINFVSNFLVLSFHFESQVYVFPFRFSLLIYFLITPPSIHKNSFRVKAETEGGNNNISAAASVLLRSGAWVGKKERMGWSA